MSWSVCNHRGHQVAAATQFIVEEKFLTQYRVPALLAVGLEGFWGLLLCAVAGPFLARLQVGGAAVDRVAEALQVRNMRRTCSCIFFIHARRVRALPLCPPVVVLFL